MVFNLKKKESNYWKRLTKEEKKNMLISKLTGLNGLMKMKKKRRVKKV